MKYRVEFEGEYEIEISDVLKPNDLRAVESFIKSSHERVSGPDIKPKLQVRVVPVVKAYTITYRDEVLLHTVVEADNLQAAADKFREQYVNCRIEEIVPNE